MLSHQLSVPITLESAGTLVVHVHPPLGKILAMLDRSNVVPVALFLSLYLSSVNIIAVELSP